MFLSLICVKENTKVNTNIKQGLISIISYGDGIPYYLDSNSRDEFIKNKELVNDSFDYINNISRNEDSYNCYIYNPILESIYKFKSIGIIKDDSKEIMESLKRIPLSNIIKHIIIPDNNLQSNNIPSIVNDSYDYEVLLDQWVEEYKNIKECIDTKYVAYSYKDINFEEILKNDILGNVTWSDIRATISLMYSDMYVSIASKENRSYDVVLSISEFLAMRILSYVDMNCNKELSSIKDIVSLINRFYITKVIPVCINEKQNKWKLYNMSSYEEVYRKD